MELINAVYENGCFSYDDDKGRTVKLTERQTKQCLNDAQACVESRMPQNGGKRVLCDCFCCTVLRSKRGRKVTRGVEHAVDL